jgi:hypothetical protein
MASYQEDLNRHQHSYENLRSCKAELLEKYNYISM